MDHTHNRFGDTADTRNCLMAKLAGISARDARVSAPAEENDASTEAAYESAADDFMEFAIPQL